MFVGTSDEYFAAERETPYDVCFLDGLHHFDQTYRDLVHALTLCPRGAILVDDVVPSDETSALRDMAESQRRRSEQSDPCRDWHGDVFRLVPCLYDLHPELQFVTIADRDNPQLLLWKPDPDVPTVAHEGSKLNRYEQLEYRDVFADGIPAEFRPSDEQGGINRAIAAIGDRFRSIPAKPRRSP